MVKRETFKDTKRFLIISFSILALVCILVLIFASMFIEKKSNIAISRVGQIYMSAMAKQTQQKFDAVINLQIQEMKGILSSHAPEDMEYGEEMISQLALSTQVRDFVYLGLFTAEGEGEMIYGEGMQYYDEKTFRRVLEDSGLRVFSGFDGSGRKLLCLLIDGSYPMKGGKTSSAMVAAIPMEYLENILALDEKSNLMYSFIIRRDGTYVVRNREEGNYFNLIRDSFVEYNDKTSEEYVGELQAAMEAQTDYTAVIPGDGTYQYLLSTHLPDSEWFLISVMPFGTLDSILDDMNSQRMNIILYTGLVILAGVVLIFVLYLRQSQCQLAELERAERVASEANRAKSEFLSSMSHDIRTPMNGIVGMTAIALGNMDDRERVENCLKKITLSSRHLLGLVNDVLDMSKIESGKLTLNMSRVSLRETMENVVNIIQPQVRARQQHFDIFIQNILTENVYCDSIRLNQILINLLSNAVKFTPEGGSISVYLKQEEAQAGKKQVRCHFRVKDNGIGMTEEFQKKIFETFTREKKSEVDKAEGSGLGMAITKAIVETMGGTIGLQSAPGQGSDFHVVLDFERADIPEEDMVLPPWRMLVVDNNEELCLSACSSLKELGIDAHWATDGQTAVEMVREQHERKNDYEIVLLDWKMPGMDGLHTAREMRRHLGKTVPILIISAYDWSDIEKEAKETEVQGFIAKPLFKSSLYYGLRQYVLNAGENDSKKQEEEERQFAGKRILLAEDNELNWEIAEAILSEAGFELERAENGKICVEKFSEAAVNRYDMVLMDIRMPVMNGYDAARAIRALDRPDAGLPIVAMTADAFSDDIQRCLDSGMNEHIAKPIDVKRLKQVLGKYL